MGQPVAGNPTQYMMEKAFAKAGLEWRYLTLEVPPDQLQDALLGLRAMKFRGGNFTIPHKVSVIPFLDGLSEAAELMGAVNCIYRQGDELLGDNTDGKGFVQSLREVTDPQDKRIVILGAGGAARAISVELGLASAREIIIVNRTAERGEALVELLNEKLPAENRHAEFSASFVRWEGDYQPPAETDILINATSIGLNDEEARVPLQYDALDEHMVVADVVFNPPQTLFLREAGQRGCTTLDGLGMLVNQGVIGFKIWTGVDPDPIVMREALEEFLGI